MSVNVCVYILTVFFYPCGKTELVFIFVKNTGRRFRLKYPDSQLATGRGGGEEVAHPPFTILHYMPPMFQNITKESIKKDPSIPDLCSREFFVLERNRSPVRRSPVAIRGDTGPHDPPRAGPLGPRLRPVRGQGLPHLETTKKRKRKENKKEKKTKTRKRKRKKEKKKKAKKNKKAAKKKPDHMNPPSLRKFETR